MQAKLYHDLAHAAVVSMAPKQKTSGQQKLPFSQPRIVMAASDEVIPVNCNQKFNDAVFAGQIYVILPQAVEHAQAVMGVSPNCDPLGKRTAIRTTTEVKEEAHANVRKAIAVTHILLKYLW